MKNLLLIISITLLVIGAVLSSFRIKSSIRKIYLEIEKVSKEGQYSLQEIQRLSQIAQETDTNQIREELVSLLKIHSVHDRNGPVKLTRYGKSNDGGYVVPEISLSMAEVLLGYGIADDISFEEQFSETFNKPSYAFDCGIADIKSKSKLFTFVKECIATDNFLYSKETSSKSITSFTEQINSLSLQDKKIFIKMDIEGAEYNAFKDICKYFPQITGIALEIHFSHHDQKSMKDAIRLISDISNNFYLVHVHGNNYAAKDLINNSFTTKRSQGRIPLALELTFINKNLVESSHISPNQQHPTDLDMPNNADSEDIEFEILY